MNSPRRVSQRAMIVGARLRPAIDPTDIPSNRMDICAVEACKLSRTAGTRLNQVDKANPEVAKTAVIAYCHRRAADRRRMVR